AELSLVPLHWPGTRSFTVATASTEIQKPLNKISSQENNTTMQDQDIKYCKKLIKKAKPELSREDKHDLLLKLKELWERNKLKEDVKEKESKEKQHMEGL